ncbi:hypothetical protein [Alicyclobacillus macrosporangiidus]|uniref:hypothetical protein n=1 Tax=Alicyclobacillus macrosporangiidus TaxID=392015 RepID=UPI001587E311|nr:hypothetical protein [Alicyclobacillus macrosporangiidus]
MVWRIHGDGLCQLKLQLADAIALIGGEGGQTAGMSLNNANNWRAAAASSG